MMLQGPKQHVEKSTGGKASEPVKDPPQSATNSRGTALLLTKEELIRISLI